MDETTEPVAAEEELPQEPEATEEPQLEEHEIIDDPGQFEGIPEEKVQYSKRVQTRINDVTKHRREAERERDSLKEQLEAEKKRIAELETKLTQAPVKEPEIAPEKPSEPPQDDLSEKLTLLKGERRTALEELDGKKAAEIQDQIDDVMVEMYKPKLDRSEITKAVREAETSAVESAFAAKNPWLSAKRADGTLNPDYDAAKAHAVVGVVEDLARTWTGTYAERLEEGLRVVEERFNPHKKPKAAAVAGVDSIKEAKPNNVIQLTQIEKEYAHKMFPDEADPEAVYAHWKPKGEN
jgi:hypothetical protein